MITLLFFFFLLNTLKLPKELPSSVLTNVGHQKQNVQPVKEISGS